MMKNKIKYIMILVGIICFVARIWMVNKDVVSIPKEDHRIHEQVIFGEGKSINKSNLPKGYAITVNESKLVSKEDLLKEYALSEKDVNIVGSGLSYSNFYIIHATVKNTNEEYQEGIGIYTPLFILQYTTGYIIPNKNLFVKINSHLPGEGFSLEAQDEIEMTLVYPIIDTYKNAILNPVRKDPLYLILSVEPQLTRIQLQ